MLGPARQLAGRIADFGGAGLDVRGAGRNRRERSLECFNREIEILVQLAEFLGKPILHTDRKIALRQALQPLRDLVDHEGTAGGLGRKPAVVFGPLGIQAGLLDAGLGLQPMDLQGIFLEHLNGTRHLADLVMAGGSRHLDLEIAAREALHDARHSHEVAPDLELEEDRRDQQQADHEDNSGDQGQTGTLGNLHRLGVGLRAFGPRAGHQGSGRIGHQIEAAGGIPEPVGGGIGLAAVDILKHRLVAGYIVGPELCRRIDFVRQLAGAEHGPVGGHRRIHPRQTVGQIIIGLGGHFRRRRHQPQRLGDPVLPGVSENVVGPDDSRLPDHLGLLGLAADGR